MSRRYRDSECVTALVKVEIAEAILIHSHLRSVLAIARGMPPKLDWSLDLNELLKTATALKLDQRLLLIHTCADLAIQIERSLSVTAAS